MAALRSAATWIAAWLLVAAGIFAGLAVWTYPQGGVFHRVPVCGGKGPDVNVYAAAAFAGGLALIVVLAYWALGAASLRWRWARVIGVVLAVGPIYLAVSWVYAMNTQGALSREASARAGGSSARASG